MQIQTHKTEPSMSKGEKVAKALEQGLKIPWYGIRKDIKLHQGPVNEHGNPTYVIEDPVRGIHFEMEENDARFFKCLAAEKDVQKALDKMVLETAIRPNIRDVLNFLRMLQRDKIAAFPPEMSQEDIDAALGVKKAGSKLRKFSITRIFFFRIPVCRPDPMLNALYPIVRPLWSKTARYIYGVMGLTGLIFMMEQLDLYLHTASFLFTPKGAIAFFLSLYLVKIFHEFGHAFAAKENGAFVRRMGIYMMFFTPMLYSDTTDAWKIPSHRSRLIIGAAGMLVEFYIACIALFLWTVLSDGLLRSLMFYLSGASLVSTLFVNINPLMRFDGYYILMDYLKISNLRTRSSAMFRYAIRKMLFDWRGPAPEIHPKARVMVVFGLFVNIYLIMITLSIGLTVYYNVSKLLGLYGIVVSFLVFFGGAMVREISYISKSTKDFGSPFRLALTGTVIAGLIILFFTPLPQTRKLPGFILFQDVSHLEATGKGRVNSRLPELGMKVDKGDILLEIKDDALEEELVGLQFELQKIQASIKNLSGGGEQGGYRKWLMAEENRILKEMEKIRENLDQLVVRAPVSGRVLHVNETLREGAYVHTNSYLLTVGDNRFYEIRAYAGEQEYLELKEQNIKKGEILFTDMETPPMHVRFRDAYSFPVRHFPNYSIFDIAGGPVPSRQSREGHVTAKVSQYPFIFEVDNLPGYIRHGTLCRVKVVGKTISLVSRLKNEAWRFLASEGLI